MAYTYAEMVRDFEAGVHPLQHMHHPNYPDCHPTDPDA